MDTCIKNVSDSAWRAFKLESVRRGLTMGALFDRIVEESINRSEKSNWDAVLSHRRRLNASETKTLRKEISAFRKGFDFR
jgi:hypothetical protein